MEQIKLRGAIEDVVAETRHNNAARDIDTHPLYIQLQEQFSRAREQLRLSELREIEARQETTKLKESMRILLNDSFRGLQKEVHENARAKGFYDGVTHSLDNQCTRIALIHSEVSEALEDIRNGDMKTTLLHDGKPIGFPTELADIVIRCMDFAEYLSIDLEAEIRQKHEYNKTRPQMHGKKL